jgi:cysteine-rich repeat protein
VRDPLRLCLTIVVLAMLGTDAGARPFEVATFPLDPGVEVAGPRVAVGTDGTMVFVWEAGGSLWSQHFSQAGASLAPPTMLAVGAHQRVAADTRGGYVVAFTRASAGRQRLYGLRLDAAGQPVGAELAVDQSATDDAVLPEVLGVPAGSAFVWQQGQHCWLRRYDPDGTPLGDALLVGDNGGGHPLAATVLDDGGITVVWHDPSVHTFLGRTFDADGSLRAGPSFLPSVSLDVQAIAATADGGFVAAGVVLFSTLRLVQFDAAFQVVRQRDVEVLPTGDSPVAALARDGAGRWLVVFATAHHDAGHTQLLGHLAPRARPLAADLTPLEPSFALAALAVPAVTTALLPSGSFVNAWASTGAPGSARGYAHVVSLCTPDVHTCGDGVLDPRCEECDAGAANDDATPDACRTSCLVPGCGDGTADAGEACDDGTASPCDGCDVACQPVAGLACGDGVLVAGCGQQCDDGNATAGDGCAPTCALERVPGGGSPASDCLAEWIVENPTNVPLLDGRGRIRRTQRCVDDDPACDVDGGVPGGCTFRVRVCSGNTDVAGCTPPPSLTGWELTKPSSKQAARRPELAAVRTAFAGIPAAVTGVVAADLCSAAVDVVVPLRGSAPAYGTGSVTLGATATAPPARRDQDGLKLICLPE